MAALAMARSRLGWSPYSSTVQRSIGRYYPRLPRVTQLVVEDDFAVDPLTVASKRCGRKLNNALFCKSLADRVPAARRHVMRFIYDEI